jgi:hypothetical protein
MASCPQVNFNIYVYQRQMENEYLVGGDDIDALVAQPYSRIVDDVFIDFF